MHALENVFKKLIHLYQNPNLPKMNSEEGSFKIVCDDEEEDEPTSYTGHGWSGYYQGVTGYQGVTDYQGTTGFQGVTGYQGFTGYQDPNWIDPIKDKELRECAELILSEGVEIERRIEA
jgi:hypothetical protein